VCFKFKKTQFLSTFRDTTTILLNSRGLGILIYERWKTMNQNLNIYLLLSRLTIYGLDMEKMLGLKHFVHLFLLLNDSSSAQVDSLPLPPLK
jgi:hypothetical protein